MYLSEPTTCGGKRGSSRLGLPARVAPHRFGIPASAVPAKPRRSLHSRLRRSKGCVVLRFNGRRVSTPRRCTHLNATGQLQVGTPTIGCCSYSLLKAQACASGQQNRVGVIMNSRSCILDGACWRCVLLLYTCICGADFECRRTGIRTRALTGMIYIPDPAACLSSS